ncbi:MAG: AI-2E family transporter [Clostridiales bacterium]|nr:AI-2E family transporter [Clostridiales bacterium]
MSQGKKKGCLCLFLALAVFVPAIRRCAWAALLALFAANAAAKPVHWLEEKGFPRWLGVALVLGGALALLAAALGWAAVRLCCVVDGLTGLFPDIPSLLARLESLAGKLPGSVGNLAVGLVGLLRQSSSDLAARMTAWAARLSAILLSALPEKGAFLLICLLSSFYAALDWPRLRALLPGLLPEDWTRPALAALRSLKAGAMGWLKAQGKLLLVQFPVLAVGLLTLGMPSAVPIAALVCAADALPLLGCGVVLLPWAGLLWLEGATLRALGMVGLWLALWLLRTVLEPRFVSTQAGTSPYFTVLAMYLGLLLFGFWGLIAAPVTLAAGTRLFHEQKKPQSR